MDIKSVFASDSLLSKMVDAVVTPVLDYLGKFATCVSGVETHISAGPGGTRRDAVARCASLPSLNIPLIGNIDLGTAVPQSR